MTGQTLGHYKILRQAGEGAMGAVYHALDQMLDREVALKALRPELASRPDVVERFREEARVQARLNHPNVAQLYALFNYGENLFMVMEYVNGRTLDAIIRQVGRIPLDQALPLFLQALDGVEHAHRMGIIHRDLKPANIMLGQDGLVKVTDFGIARVLGSARMTREGGMVGTLEYMSPERVLGKELDARSDVYSLGFVLYEMLSGVLPFTGDTDYEIMRAQIETPAPSVRAWVPDVPPEIEQAILKAMAKKQEDRHASVADFAAALRRYDPRTRPLQLTPAPRRQPASPTPPSLCGRQCRPPPSPSRSLPRESCRAARCPPLLEFAKSPIGYGSSQWPGFWSSPDTP
jgi:serine/threonine protein kinase